MTNQRSLTVIMEDLWQWWIQSITIGHRGQRSLIFSAGSLISRVLSCPEPAGKQAGTAIINIFQSSAVYCNLSLSFKHRQWSLAYFWDLITFFIHREVRFRYRRSIAASIMLTLLIRKMLYEDRLVYWICSAAGNTADKSDIWLAFQSVFSSNPCAQFTHPSWECHLWHWQRISHLGLVQPHLKEERSIYWRRSWETRNLHLLWDLWFLFFCRLPWLSQY